VRIGAITGHPDALEPIRLAVPVYSVNIAAVVAVQAALQDLAYMEQDKAQVEEAKTRLYAACDRLGLRYWKRAERLAQGAAARGIYVRNRSKEPGLEGCLRVGAGVVAHTERCIDVFEEVLCGAE